MRSRTKGFKHFHENEKDASEILLEVASRKECPMATTLKRSFLGPSFLLIFAIFPSVLSFGRLAEAQPLKEVRIASSTTVSFTNLSTFYARDRRFFEKEGVDIKIIVVQTNAALAALVTGIVDYTPLSTPTIEAALRGMPLRLVAVTSQQPVWGLVVRKGITRITDLLRFEGRVSAKKSLCRQGPEGHRS